MLRTGALSGFVFAFFFLPGFFAHGQSDTVAPFITALSPAAATENVAVDAPITITFSEPMLASTVNASTVSLTDTESGFIPLLVSLSSDGLIATLFPETPLLYGHFYLYTVTTGVSDLAGNHPTTNLVDGGEEGYFVTAGLSDTTPPTVSSVSAQGATFNTLTGSPQTVTITFSESMRTGGTVLLDGVAQSTNTCSDFDYKTFCFSYSIPSTTESAPAIEIGGAQDAAFVSMAATSSFSFTVDTIAPTLSITSGPEEGATTTSPVTFNFTTDAESAVCAFDGTATSTCTSPASSSLSDGAHFFTVVATDAAGNSTTSIRTFIVETPEPEPEPTPEPEPEPTPAPAPSSGGGGGAGGGGQPVGSGPLAPGFQFVNPTFAPPAPPPPAPPTPAVAGASIETSPSAPPPSTAEENTSPSFDALEEASAKSSEEDIPASVPTQDTSTEQSAAVVNTETDNWSLAYLFGMVALLVALLGWVWFAFAGN